MLTRRELMNRTALAGVFGTVGLAGCTPTQIATALQQAAADATTIATSLKTNVLPIVATLAGLSPASITKITTAITDMQSVAAAISGASSASAAQPSVQQLEADFSAVIGALAGLPLPAPIPVILSAAAVLVPGIEAAVGLLIPPSAAPPAMTPDMARALLAAAK